MVALDSFCRLLVHHYCLIASQIIALLHFGYAHTRAPKMKNFFFLNDPAPTEIYTLPLHAPLPIGERLDAGRGVAGRAGGSDEDAPELLLAPGREEGRALHRPHARLDADGGKIVRDRLAHRGVREIGRAHV